LSQINQSLYQKIFLRWFWNQCGGIRGRLVCVNKLRRCFVNGVYLYQYSDLKSTMIERYLRHCNLEDNSSFINSIRVHEPAH